MTNQELQAKCAAMLDALERVVVGKRGPLRLLLAAILADGHVLIEDVPGVAKTSAARALSQLLGLPFKRVQFTPDLLPADLTGSFMFNQRQMSFEFRRGPIFTQLLLADEINRAAPKTQSALLEAMQERQVTAEGETFMLDHPFIVIATQNPIELEGTYPLPEAQLDRFLIRLDFGYPSSEEELEILRLRRERQSDTVVLRPLVATSEVLAMQSVTERIFVEPSIETYIVSLVRATREEMHVALGASPRASLGLMRMSSALAAMEGRSFVTPDDVKACAVPILAHRLMLRPESWGGRISTRGIVTSILGRIPAPAVELA